MAKFQPPDKEYEKCKADIDERFGIVAELSVSQLAAYRQKSERYIRDHYEGNIHGGFIDKKIIISSLMEANRVAEKKARKRARASKQKSPAAG